MTGRPGGRYRVAVVGLNHDHVAGWVESLGRLGNPIFDRAAMGGGVLHRLGGHDLDALQWPCGEPIVEVQAMAGTVGGEAIAVEDTVSMRRTPRPEPALGSGCNEGAAGGGGHGIHVRAGGDDA